jgi:phage tail sheath protein FI
MASTYKTPGVYVEEVSKFPPSVAPVATAIPAFIGYTERAVKNGESLLFKPTKINSFVEFEEYFGGAPDRDVTLRLNSVDQFVSVASNSNTYLLYDCLRLFYNNGGGDCYIVSVGDYDAPPNIGSITGAPPSGILGGLKALEKYDEPTLILSPDATLLDSAIYDFHKQALIQCNKLQDRFLIADLLRNDENVAGETADERVQQFRDNIGINSLKYGAAYWPYLRTTLSAGLTYRDVLFAREGGPVPDQASSRGLLFSLTADNDIRQLIYDLENAMNAALSMEDEIDPDNAGNLVDGSSSLAARFKSLTDAFEADMASFDEGGGSSWGDTSLDEVYGAFLELLSAIFEIYDALPEEVSNIPNPTAAQTVDLKLRTDVENFMEDAQPVFEALVNHHRQVNSAGAIDLFDTGALSTEFDNTWALFGYAGPADLTDTVAIANDTDIGDAYTAAAGGSEPIESQLNLAGDAAKGAVSAMVKLFADILSAARSYESTFDASLKAVFGTYKSLLARAEQELMVLPPSAAMAGIYTFVDNTRGVWKAPANVSLSAVSAPLININAQEQETLNVDANAGKSINAIRPFTGKGLLVWGARTLAGNDNEWRYVSVRRFFNFAEESIKKATERFVFEPNDANTWVKVKAMIENFLVLQWRAGALAGAKPEQAFFVKIGLGETMTPLDILEGRMIVEIGMAVVRPAEFIILRFSHKMQES